MLATYLPFDEVEEHHLARFRSFLARYPNPFDRTLLEGHLTGSAFILDASLQRVLMMHHRKVQKWLQPGGHAEPDETDPEAVALREAREETGLEKLVWHPAAARPFDLDIHEFPARDGDPAHSHFDIRYLLVASRKAVPELAVAEATDLRWFGWDELSPLNLDLGTERALKKARALADTRTIGAVRQPWR